MKVCFLAPELYPIWGGGGVYAINLLQHLSKKIEMHVLTLRRKVPESEEDFSEGKIHDLFGNNVNINFISNTKLHSSTFFCHAKFQYYCYHQIKKLHKKHGFDIIHSQHQPMSDILLKFLNKKFNYLTTIHETFARRNMAIKNSGISFSELESSEKWMFLLSPFLKKIENSYIKKSINLISPSNWMKNIIKKDFSCLQAHNANINVVYNGVDHKKFNPKASKSEFIQKLNNEAGGPIVLFSGRMISTKGVHFFIKAIPKIIQQIRDVYIIFVGGGNSLPYRKMLINLNIPKKNYNFLGYIPNFDDLPGLYSSASVFVAPTLYENFPFRILENMSCQNPVVASNIVGIPEMIKDQVNGLLVNPWDVDSLAKNIILLLCNQTLAKKIGQNARETIEKKFTLQKFSKDTAAVYKKVIDNYTS